MLITCTRFHDLCMGHRVVNHESKCKNLHGHNYRIHFTLVSPELDYIGRVLDFSDIKNRLCNWLELNWDHRMLLWAKDPLRHQLINLDPSIILTDFNPTAENIAKHLLTIVGPSQLVGTDCKLIKVVVDETRKCSATAEVPYVPNQ